VNIGFRTDASAAIGLGHLARCLSLAIALREAGADSTFVVRDLGFDASRRVRAEGFEAIVLPVTSNDARASDAPREPWTIADPRDDAERTAEALAGSAPGWVVVDHYGLDARWHRSVAAALGCRIAAIDDLADRDLEVALLVDPNLHADHRARYRDRLPDTTPILAGPGFALLGPAYRTAPRCALRPSVGSIGVFMGGADAGGFSELVLRALDAVGFDGDTEVVTTTANPALDALRDAVASRPRARLAIDLPQLSTFFARHDVQVGAAGGATWERCCIGAPTVGTAVADNQRAVLEPLAGLGAIVPIDGTPPSVAALAQGLDRLIADAALRARLSGASRRLVDGRGAARVAERLLHA
jgi:UDP-2,4-diacetamido-2,4,6-trideoxy-beta-L-altropyranose hydrolase